jgi:hypothetical protein
VSTILVAQRQYELRYLPSLNDQSFDCHGGQTDETGEELPIDRVVRDEVILDSV